MATASLSPYSRIQAAQYWGELRAQARLYRIKSYSPRPVPAPSLLAHIASGPEFLLTAPRAQLQMGMR
jgi:hypothetical protein